MRPTELLMLVAERLGELKNRVVFVGGATSELLITDPATPPVSATKDIDVIISVTAVVVAVTPSVRKSPITKSFRRPGL